MHCSVSAAAVHCDGNVDSNFVVVVIAVVVEVEAVPVVVEVVAAAARALGLTVWMDGGEMKAVG